MRIVQRLTSSILGTTLVLAALLVHATPAAAECTGQANRWPSFDAVAPSARQVVIGRVSGTNKGSETDGSPVFTLKVEEVLRGTAPAVIEVSSLRSGLPLHGGPACRRDATLRAGPGDRIALALGGRLSGIKGRVNTAVWIEGRPDTHINPGLRLMKPGKVRRVLGLEPHPARGETGTTDTWRKIARSPFGAHLPAYGWTGEKLVVVDVRSGRTADYDPATDSWTEHDRAPDRYDPFVAWVWTGSELLILPDRLVADPAAFDPATETWRTGSPMPSDIYFDPEHAVWTGEMVVVAGGSPPQAATYDPVGDTWERLPSLPGGHDVIGLTWTGSHVLAETQLFDDQAIDVALLEPGSQAWVPGTPGLVKPGVGPGLWMGDALVYLHGDEEVAGSESNAAYDPDRDEWRPVERACDVDTIEGLATGRLIVDHSGRRAMDVETGECHHYPKPPHRLYGGGVKAWTGSEAIYWSGIGSLIDPPERKGLALRPTADNRLDAKRE